MFSENLFSQCRVHYCIYHTNGDLACMCFQDHPLRNPLFKEMWKKQGELLLLLNWCIMCAFISSYCFNTNVKCLTFRRLLRGEEEERRVFSSSSFSYIILVSMLLLMYVAFWLTGMVHKWCFIQCKILNDFVV